MSVWGARHIHYIWRDGVGLFAGTERSLEGAAVRVIDQRGSEGTAGRNATEGDVGRIFSGAASVTRGVGGHEGGELQV